MKEICSNCGKMFENRASEYCSLNCAIENFEKRNLFPN